MLTKKKNKRELPNKVLINCKICSTEFKGRTIDKYCSDECRKIASDQQQYDFRVRNPDKNKQYNQNRVAKNPKVWIDKWKAEREKIIQMLGGKCIVCPVTNHKWLHVDYIPAMRGTGYRHPRHLKWVTDHIKDFRLLCANHHYELTLTGKIEGTNITQ